MIGGTGREIRLPAWYLAQGNVRLGYAHTLAGCQGITVGSPGPDGRRGTAHALLTPEMTRNEAYVAVSRAVTENHAYLQVGGGTDPHQVVKPEAVQPETLAEQFTAILSRDGSATSATTEIRDAADPHLQLGHASDAYADAIVAGAESLLGEERLQQITDDAERAVPGVTSAPAWSTLLGSSGGAGRQRPGPGRGPDRGRRRAGNWTPHGTPPRCWTTGSTPPGTTPKAGGRCRGCRPSRLRCNRSRNGTPTSPHGPTGSVTTPTRSATTPGLDGGHRPGVGGAVPDRPAAGGRPRRVAGLAVRAGRRDPAGGGAAAADRAARSPPRR